MDHSKYSKFRKIDEASLRIVMRESEDQVCAVGSGPLHGSRRGYCLAEWLFKALAMFALMPHKQAALLCLHTYWISDGSAHKDCFCWVNTRPMMGWVISEQVCQVEGLESSLDCLDRNTSTHVPDSHPHFSQWCQMWGGQRAMVVVTQEVSF